MTISCKRPIRGKYLSDRRTGKFEVVDTRHSHHLFLVDSATEHYMYVLCPFSEKIAEADRKFHTLKSELHLTCSMKTTLSLSTMVKSNKAQLAPKSSKKMEGKKQKTIADLKLAFSEFYLSLVLIQNYQVFISSEHNLDHFSIIICCPISNHVSLCCEVYMIKII